jgi:hypothetical protein
MAIDISTLMFTDEDDVVPASGEEQIVNTGSANTLTGDDIITGTAIRGRDTVNTIYNGVPAIYNIGTLNTDDGNDLIMGIRNEQEGNDNDFSYDLSYGILNEKGIIDTGEGNDTIIGINNITNSGSTSSSFGIDYYFGTLNTGNGNDIITGTAKQSGFRGYGGILDTGNGNDIITGTGQNGIESYWRVFSTGDGDDTLIGNGDRLGSGIVIASLNTGDGKDIIIGTNTTGKGTGISNNLYSNGDFSISNPSLETENDNDIITGIGFIGIYNSGAINTGNGDDIISGIGTRWGLENFGTINTGNGNDSIITEGGFFSRFSESNTVGSTFLGDGKDYLKGFGRGNFNGGNGKDTLELTSGTYIIEISETTVNFVQPNSIPFEPGFHDTGTAIMATSEFEKLIAGSKKYNFSSLTNGQTIIVA